MIVQAAGRQPQEGLARARRQVAEHRLRRRRPRRRRSPAPRTRSSSTTASAAAPARGCTSSRALRRRRRRRRRAREVDQGRPRAGPRDGDGPAGLPGAARARDRYLDSVARRAPRRVVGGSRVGDTRLLRRADGARRTRTGEMKVDAEEIFGPVVTRRCRSRIPTTIAAEANDTIYGLAAGVWTRDISKAHRLGKRGCAPARCGSTATTCSTPRCRSAATRSRAGAARWVTRHSSCTPRSRRSAPSCDARRLNS